MSDTPKMDKDRRTWLIATSAVGGCGAAAVAYPFLDSFQPSERAKAAGAPVEVDISGMKPDEIRTVEWRGKPVWVLRRTPEQVGELPKLDGELADPKSLRDPAALTPTYARNDHRSIKPEYLVVVGISMLMLAPVGVATAATKPTINPKQVLTCPTPVIPQPLTGGNGTTSLITTVGTSLSSSSYKTLVGVGNYSYAMNPTTANAGAITFDTNTAVIKISTGATAGTYLETVTALALDTATVTQNFLELSD